MRVRLRHAALALLGASVASSAGCYERVVRTRHGDVVSEVSKPDFDEKPGALDELMWGPVPAGQDPETYYRKKKQLMAK